MALLLTQLYGYSELFKNLFFCNINKCIQMSKLEEHEKFAKILAKVKLEIFF